MRLLALALTASLAVPAAAAALQSAMNPMNS